MLGDCGWEVTRAFFQGFEGGVHPSFAETRLAIRGQLSNVDPYKKLLFVADLGFYWILGD